MTLSKKLVVAQELVVEDTLAEDDTSIVVAARHIALGKRVAVRVLSHVQSDTRFVSRFARAKAVRSDHAPELLDVGSMPDGRPYIVMEYLEGTPLSRGLEGGPLPIADAVDYVVEACDAIGASHAAGLVHKKLRTSSLFLVRGPRGESVVKVLNLGTAPSATSDVLLKSERAADYLAPEQIADPQHVDASCDIWALGVILYETITGKTPFGATSASRTHKRILDAAPKAPRSLRHDVPEELERAILRCLARSPKERFETASALAAAIAPFGTERSKTLVARTLTGRRSRASAPPVSSPPVSFASAPPAADDDQEKPTLVVRPTERDASAFSADVSEPGFRKMTKDGRIEALDVDDVARVVRAKRVADEAEVLARNAASSTQIQIDDEKTDHTGSARMRSIAPPGFGRQEDLPRIDAPVRQPVAPSPDRSRLILTIVLLVVAVLTGITAGVIIRNYAMHGRHKASRSGAQMRAAPP